MTPAENIKMTPADYMEKRLEDQFRYYDVKSAKFQQTYYRLRTLEICAAALIPFLSALSLAFKDYAEWGTIAVGLLGIIVTITAGRLSLRRYRENWIAYRKAAESLKRERFLFETQVPPYDTDSRFNVLVRNVELILGEENAGWGQNMLKPVEEEKPLKP